MTAGNTRGRIVASMLALACAGLAASPRARGQDDEAKVLRAGLIGLDTSHVVAFTRVLNAEGKSGPLARVRVVAGFPGGSPDIPSSADRVEGFTASLRDDYGVEIVDSIDALLEKVDVVFLESVDGRPHLEQARPVIEAGKPLFIDKPMAGSLADAIAIFDLAEEAGVPCFSSSSLRFQPEVESASRSTIVGAMTYGPCSLEEHHPDLFWYGVHGVEMLYALMGPGCESVARSSTDGTDVVTGTWDDGRIGSYRGIRDGKSGFGAVVFGTDQISPIQVGGNYEPMLEQVCQFFLDGRAPVPPEETIELFAFMEAADESKARGGAPVSIAETIEQARAGISSDRPAVK
ncbi:Gfo/Idh/MocA family protein [Tautonia plasticadhaerens]|uniref:Oxidoreductase family, NAD-binding Rossmann fold n=1 Tax=Tautonia plasticadhaerens TaxID=2527974 RepID=A0A518GY88_9BACT|nr:Gfo/Idh/MocA family oxidoreductase [Tautonia plasticadhaerens]QDV33550.1 Oxidoreductase family, NAD-binding Rossmann fold [Tautonia plasticadhaerens]